MFGGLEFFPHRKLDWFVLTSPSTVVYVALPPEVLQLIGSHLLELAFKSKKDLLSCVRVCRSWYEPFMDLIYHTIDILHTGNVYRLVDLIYVAPLPLLTTEKESTIGITSTVQGSNINNINKDSNPKTYTKVEIETHAVATAEAAQALVRFKKNLSRVRILKIPFTSLLDFLFFEEEDSESSDFALPPLPHLQEICLDFHGDRPRRFEFPQEVHGQTPTQGVMVSTFTSWMVPSTSYSEIAPLSQGPEPIDVRPLLQMLKRSKSLQRLSLNLGPFAARKQHRDIERVFETLPESLEHLTLDFKDQHQPRYYFLRHYRHRFSQDHISTASNNHNTNSTVIREDTMREIVSTEPLNHLRSLDFGRSWDQYGLEEPTNILVSMIQHRCPSLEELQGDGLESCKDTLQARIISVNSGSWKTLSGMFGPLAMAAILEPKTLSSLENVRFQYCSAFSSASIQKLLCSAPKLKRFDNYPEFPTWEEKKALALMAKDIIESSENWCLIGGIPRPELEFRTNGRPLHDDPLNDPDLHSIMESQMIQRQVLSQLGRLTQLKEITLGLDTLDTDTGNHDLHILEGENEGAYFDYADFQFQRQYTCLELSLESGLDRLQGLKNLRRLHVENMAVEIEGPQEKEWIKTHWPNFGQDARDRFWTQRGYIVQLGTQQLEQGEVDTSDLATNDRLKSLAITTLNLPELAQVIFSHLDNRTIHTLRLVNRNFLNLCRPFFAITLDVDDHHRYTDLGHLVTLSLKGAANTIDPMDQIQGLKVNRGHDEHSYAIISQGIPGALNRCQNLRHIELTDLQGYSEPPEKPTYPARMVWPSLAQHRYMRGEISPNAKNEHGHKDDRNPWSYWDLLPLEGFLLSRLETLVVVAGNWTPGNLDRFFKRLARSCVSKSLRSLAVVGYERLMRRVSWEVLRDCVCGIKSLEALRLEHLDIIPSMGTNNNNNGAITITRQHPQGQWSSPGVKTLVFKCHPDDMELKQAIIELFPNLESLTLTEMDCLLDPATDRLVFENAIAASNGPSIPFPKLKSIDTPMTWLSDWLNSRAFQTWARTAAPDATRPDSFRLDSLSLEPYELASCTCLIKILMTTVVSLRKLVVRDGRDWHWIGLVLTSPLCQELEELALLFTPPPGSELKEDGAGLLLSCCYSSPAAWRENGMQFSSAQGLLTSLPWTRTITKLYLISAILDARAEKSLETQGNIEFMRELLRHCPQLVDFTIQDPILDLDLFTHLGRPSNLVKDNCKIGKGDFNEDTAPFVLENYCVKERPLLERLQITRSYLSEAAYGDADALLSWRKRLLSQFRFLRDLTLTQEPTPTHLVRKTDPSYGRLGKATGGFCLESDLALR
ncbi:hypothetical protein BGZ83_006845 [Gryganskiella cystojenkinii]|nr:hypothetical protein BGZ83_006845 [Gryganskiella cystojenkinii]